MKKNSVIFFFSLWLMSCFLLLTACMLDNTPPAPDGTDTVEINEQLTLLVEKNGGDEIRLNLANTDEYTYFLARLAMAGKTKENSPQLYEAIENTRQAHWAAKNRGEEVSRTVPDGSGHWIVDLEKSQENAVFTSCVGSVRDSSYIFLDICTWDGKKNPITSYTAEETFEERSLVCKSEGVLSEHYTLSRNQDQENPLLADSILCYVTRNMDGDFEDELTEPLALISYVQTKVDLNNLIYPDSMSLYHPNTGNAVIDAYPDVCIFCLACNGTECDYDSRKIESLYGCDISVDWRGNILIPFKGEIHYRNLQIKADPTNPQKPDPQAEGTVADARGKLQPIRNIDLVLYLEESGGIAKKIKADDTDFFWNHENTIISFDPDTSTSTLSWDLPIDFGGEVFCNSHTVNFFIRIDVPLVREGSSSCTMATAVITPQAYYPEIPLTCLREIPHISFYWNCIAAGSRVRMADGKYKNIETITAGELILSTNNTNLVVNRVVAREENSQLYRLIDQFNHCLLLTQGHPVVMADYSKRSAGDLQAGDRIMSENGPAELVSITTEPYEGSICNLLLSPQAETMAKDTGAEGYTLFANGILIGDR